MKRIRIAGLSKTAGVIAASLLMAGVAAVSPAAADPPDVTRYPDYGTTSVFPDPVNGYASRCEFPVMLQDEGKGVEIAFADGRFFATAPGLRGTATNLDTGKSIDYMANGSVHISPPTPVGTQGHYVQVMRFTGPLVYLPAGQLTWYTGQTVIVAEYDQSDNLVNSEITSTRAPLDMCAALAQ